MYKDIYPHLFETTVLLYPLLLINIFQLYYLSQDLIKLMSIVTYKLKFVNVLNLRITHLKCKHIHKINLILKNILIFKKLLQ
jgi:hypothetical protein